MPPPLAKQHGFSDSKLASGMCTAPQNGAKPTREQRAIDLITVSYKEWRLALSLNW